MSDTESSSADSRPSDFNDGAEAILNTTFGAHRAGKGVHRSRSSTPQSHKDSCPGPDRFPDRRKEFFQLQNDYIKDTNKLRPCLKRKRSEYELNNAPDNFGQGSTNGKKVSWKHDRLRRRFGHLIDEILGVLEATLLEQHVVVISIDAVQVLDWEHNAQTANVTRGDSAVTALPSLSRAQLSIALYLDLDSATDNLAGRKLGSAGQDELWVSLVV
ncbi:uncharacterized protein F5891DRAFT_974969 [Suillus fuscotomentosus]|uniref:Uncharacterized protein n=1 Tax=Suillus fuscotomentosus TaxID=1912939 RepID=A0AAD4EJI3_9AGAM|nr:uncharacterized protein F5891DRAFT_974969 [Suillus fuscotomentosus]KAG1907216.1 hypothetical protein F5891DRAFT_974969 [Suillus fuscotomentosus]